MRLEQCRQIVIKLVSDIGEGHFFSFAAALSYYFLLALFPALIAFATLVGYLPIPHLVNTIVGAMAHVVPPESMGLVRRVVADVVSRNHAALLSFGLLGALWTCSSAFSTMIEALNLAYNASETRSFWKTRLLTVELTFLIGIIVTIAFAFLAVGPHFGRYLAATIGLSRAFVASWPFLQHVVAALLMVLGVEGLYFMAPNVKHGFLASLPGSVFAVAGWMALSDGLSFYFQKFDHLNKTYGVLGGGIALLVWLYWSGFVILIGAAMNAEIIRLKKGTAVTQLQPVSPEVHAHAATNAN